MHKHKIRIIGVVSVLAIVLCIALIPQIYAVETEETQQTLNCAELADQFGIYIKATDTTNKYLLVKDIPTCNNPNENHATTEFQVITVNGTGVENGGKLNVNNKEVTIEAGLLQNGTTHYLEVVLKNTDPAAEGLAYQYLTVKYTETAEPAGNSTINKVYNTNYDGVCVAYRQKAATLGNDGFTFYKQSIPDCWETMVLTNKDASELQTKMNNIEKLWEAYSNSSAMSNPNFLTEFNRIKNNATTAGNVVSNPSSETFCLNCKYNFLSTGDGAIKTYTNEYGENIQSTEYYLNKDYYYTISPTETDTVTYTYNYAVGNTVKVTKNACERTCEESVKVEYGPPVASKAGLCFEYKVKVTSYVKCNAKFVAPLPDQPSSACTPAPKCTSLSGTERNKPQAGPSDEFDTCVQSCDGGKYTEKCSLSCYKQVYGKVPTKLAIDYETSKATRLSYNDSYSITDCLNDNQGYYGCYGRTSSSINWYALDNYKNAAGEIVSTPTILYNNKNSLGRWYLDRAKISSNYWGGGYDISGISDSCTSGYCGIYVADGNGFYRRNYSGSLCTDNCIWQTNSCPENTYLNPGTIVADYNANKALYDSAATACIASTTCETHEATFTISLKYDTEDENDVTTVQRIDFPFTSSEKSITKALDEEPGTKATLTPTKALNDSIILDKAGCYSDSTSNNQYMTEWGFPGTYVHNKTGEISYEPTKAEGWYYDSEKFCMPLDAESVNEKWWEWYKIGGAPELKDDNSTYDCYTKAAILNQLKPNSCNQTAEEAEQAKKSSNGYNIIANTRSFGKFKWNFDIKCFYGIRNEICNPDDNKCCGTTTKENNGTINYTFRTIDSNNMFPNAIEPGVVDSTKREIGFNWTEKAQTSKNESYLIDPISLRNAIKEKAYTLYSDESENLDYQFYLTPSALAKIKSYNNNNDYASWDGDVELVNGVYVYYSNLFRSSTKGTKVLSEIDDAVILLGVPGKNNQTASDKTLATR